MTLAFKVMRSPVGDLKLIASDKGLVAILWENDDPQRVRVDVLSAAAMHGGKAHPRKAHTGQAHVRQAHEAKIQVVLRGAERQLKDYFAGKLKVFSLKFDFVGTAFQKKVWQALLTIPFGETRSYSDIAKQIGKPKAVRAVGAANGRNPISIIAPCHRVIGANGKLTGFAGGLKAKAFLLKLEGATVT
jgi:methylated-DNA-[protein]-cysteine S-methyltransferase